MRDFDEERRETIQEALRASRGFRVGGETFRFRATVRPETLFGFENADRSKGTLVLAALDQIVLDCVLPEDGEKWRRVRESEEVSLGLQEIEAVVNYCVEQVNARPTSPAADSSGGQETTGTLSTVEQPSEDSILLASTYAGS